MKLVPLIVTLVPTGPLVGRERRDGGRIATAARDGEVGDARSSSAWRRHGDRPGRGTGRDVRRDVGGRVDEEARVGLVPLNVTLRRTVKFVPWTSTCVPTAPLVGLNPVTVGGLPPPWIWYVWTQVVGGLLFDHSCWR